MRTASVRRTVAAALIAGAFGTAGTAQAASQQDNFSGGVLNDTAVVDGGVELAMFSESFSTSPAWTTTQWSIPDCPADGGSNVAGGVMSVDAARVDSGTGQEGSSLKFRATFGGEPFQHVGFGVDFNAVSRWAMFTTSNTTNKVYARVENGTVSTAVEVPNVTPGNAYDFRIDWKPSGFDFFVNGTLVPEPATGPHPAITLPMTAQISDCLKPAMSSVPVTVDSMLLNTKTTGTYTSKVFDAGTAAVTGINFSGTSASGITYETSTSSDNVNWTPFSTGAIQPARYFKYRATFSAANPGVSPRLSTATVDFSIASPPAGGGNNTPPSDTKKPKLGLPRDADVNRRGKVKILLTCPDDELFCRAALVFKSGRKTIASKSGKIAGGDSRYITLKLSTAAKKQLAKARKLKVAATLTVIDAAGNKRTSSKKIWLYPM